MCDLDRRLSGYQRAQRKGGRSDGVKKKRRGEGEGKKKKVRTSA